MSEDCNHNWKKDQISNMLFRYGEIELAKLRKSRFNPRELKKEHLAEIKESMEREGQYCPITCVEVEPTSDGKEFDVLDGWHRYSAGAEIGFSTVQAKIYHRDTPLPVQKKMAIYLNQGVKRINAGEFYRAADDLYGLTYRDLESRGAKVINEARVVAAAGVKRKEERMRLTVGRVVHKLQQDSDSAIHKYISDAQVPKKVITEASGDHATQVLTAMNVGYLLRRLCREDPVGPWDPWGQGLSEDEYETMLLRGEIKLEDDLRADEYENTRKLMDLIAVELLEPWLSTGQYDIAMAFCKHHISQRSRPYIHPHSREFRQHEAKRPIVCA